MANATLTTLVSKLKTRSRIDAGAEGFSDPGDFNEVITEAVRRHNSSYLTTSDVSVPEREIFAVVLLSWADLSFMRASNFAAQASINSNSGYGSDRDTPFDKCLRLQKELMKQYAAQCSSLGIVSTYSESSPEIGDVAVISADSEGATVPSEVASLPPAPDLSAVDLQVQADDTLRVKWSPWRNIGFLRHTLLHRVGTSPILDASLTNEELGIYGVNNDAEVVASVTDVERNSVKFTGLDKTSGTVHRFVVVRFSKSGKYTFSNELTITQA